MISENKLPSIREAKNKHKAFIQHLKVKNKYYEKTFSIISEYTSIKNKILLKTNFGECKMSYSQLLKGNKPDISTALNKEDYAKNLIEFKTNKKLNYSILKYNGSLDVRIYDGIGECSMSLSSLCLGYTPSIRCAINKDEYFSSNLKIINKNIDWSKINILSKYINNKSKMYVQDEKGVYNILASSLLTINSLPWYSALNKEEIYLNKFAKKNIIYKNIEFNNILDILLLKCSVHNIEFEQTVNSHSKCYLCCPKCQRLSSYIFEEWAKIRPENEGIFYIIRCFNENEEFYKFGITCTSIKERYYNNKNMPYNYEIISQIKDKDRRKIWDYEKEFEAMIDINKFNYKPKIFFKGSVNECFKVHKEDYIKIINKFRNGY